VRSTYPKSGGAFKVQVYSPYVFVNKTGLPFDLAAKTWTGGQKPVAGRDLFASTLHSAKDGPRADDRIDDFSHETPTPFSKDSIPLGEQD
jgi:hypothetical protein